MDMYQQQPQYYGVPWNNSMNMAQPQYAVNPQQYYYPPQQTVAQQLQPVVQQQAAPAGYAPAYVPDTNTVQRTTTLPQPTFQPPAMPQNVPVGYNVMGNSNNNSKPPKNRKESVISKNRRERGKAWVIETQAIKLFNMTESIIFDMACGNMTDEDNNDLLNDTLANSIINYCDLRCFSLSPYVNLMTMYRTSIANTLEGQAYNQIHDVYYKNLVSHLEVYAAVRDSLKQYIATQNRSYLESLYNFLSCEKPCRRGVVYINRLLC